MAEEEAAAVFFIGIGGAEVTAAVRPTVLDGGRPASAVLVALLAGADASGGAADFAGLTGFFATVAALADGVAGFFGALFSFVGGAFAAEEIFFAAGTAGFAATALVAADLVAGIALAAGFFTVTGSLNELERAFTGCLLPREPPRVEAPGSTLSECSQRRTPGLYPRKPAGNLRRPLP